MPQLSNILSLIHQYEQKYARSNVKLLASSKGQSVEKLMTLYDEGQRIFGENYLQEALEKMSLLSNKDIEWHFIGSIQRNKTRKIAEHFSWVQTVADPDIAKRLNEQRPPHLPPINICIEVNISAEASKSGAQPADVLPLATYCSTLPHLKLRGLMTIPEQHDDFATQRNIFHELFLLYQSLQQHFPIDTLSMGMTNDLEAAIAEGSTMVRIGRGLFGERS